MTKTVPIKPGCYSEPPPVTDRCKMGLADYHPPLRLWYCPKCQEYHEFSNAKDEENNEQL